MIEFKISNGKGLMICWECLRWASIVEKILDVACGTQRSRAFRCRRWKSLIQKNRELLLNVYIGMESLCRSRTLPSEGKSG